MTIPAPRQTTADRDLYPLHQEDDVPEIPRHERQNSDLRTALRIYFPEWFITGNVCIYWEPDNRQRYVAPDLFVVRDWRPEEEPRVYLRWEDPPIAFIAEVLSLYDFKPRQATMESDYATHLRAPEYLSFHLERQELRFRRLGPQGYEEVAPEPNGRFRSQELQLEFGIDEAGDLRIYTLEGEKLPIAEELRFRLTEEEQRRGDAEARARLEARQRQEAQALADTATRYQMEAEARADEETRRRQEAETQVAAEARQRQEAEARVAEEARQRQEAEARARDLERQLAELQARMQKPDA